MRNYNALVSRTAKIILVLCELSQLQITILSLALFADIFLLKLKLCQSAVIEPTC